MTREEAIKAIVQGKHHCRGYPRHYTLRVTGGWGLFATEGKHRGAALGSIYLDGTLLLYGRKRFAKWGGRAHNHPGGDYYMHWSGGRWRGWLRWNRRERWVRGKVRRWVARP